MIPLMSKHEKQIKIDWSKGQKTPIGSFQPDVHSFLLEEVFISSLGVTDHSVKGFTDLNWNGSIIRAHSSYRVWDNHGMTMLTSFGNASQEGEFKIIPAQQKYSCFSIFAATHFVG